MHSWGIPQELPRNSRNGLLRFGEDPSLKHDLRTSFSLDKRPRISTSGVNLAGVMVDGCTHCIHLVSILETVWGGSQPQTWPNYIIFTHSTSDPGFTNLGSTWPVWTVTVLGCTQMPLRQHANGSNTLYVQYEFGKQYEVDLSLNHDVMTSFTIHKWPDFPNLGQIGQWDGMCARIWPWDSIPVARQTLCIWRMWIWDVGSGMRWISVSMMTSWHCSYSTRDLNSQIWVPTWLV